MINKLQHWRNLPWSLVLLGDDDQERARRAAASMLEVFDLSEQVPMLHHRLTCYCFRENISFRAELEALARGEPSATQPGSSVWSTSCSSSQRLRPEFREIVELQQFQEGCGCA